MTARAAIAAGFAAILAAVVVTDLLARRPGSRVRPFGETVAGALRTRAGRILVFGAWLWLGWHFLAR